ncbi:bifunctional metallophosphatase/5'-nucleotidase [Facklamia sp. DSM 111018]|uniref:Bifunctional metallophosphatase/5'-nucleotidase n=1 Tax=Facklamia lactis TaxID=2749967 RepID=A0ABS0LP10_9LACT|nr:5'-nucleotidase C-terminal domain-containing protein [Facklamia lactis]MBG9980086.1 bifunctional metallophosphatase/5'-nucleotidase [Facklamia lactis]MBG9985888.1 bifunctional metallophosphatase/5'-nucleotidase [Facklamia lactis]
MEINIYHTNDIHSNFNFLKQVNQYILQHKCETDLYFDSGDFADLKSLIVQSDKGETAFELLVSSGLDLMTFGNNEIDLGSESIEKLVRQGLPVISANLVSASGEKIPGLFSSTVLNKAGVRFLIIGLAPYYGEGFKCEGYNQFFSLVNLKTIEAFEAVQTELERHKGCYDYTILLSHSGYAVDRKLLDNFPMIDLILGGHSHDTISHHRYSQSGMGEKLGKIVLSVSNNKIKVIQNEQIDLKETDNFEFEELYQNAKLKADSLLATELQIIEELLFDPFHECQLMNFLCDALFKNFESDFAIMHHGIAEKSLIRPVSRKSLIENFPSKLNPTIYEIPGEQIREAILLSFDQAHIRQTGRGAGFRGSVLGGLAVSHNVRIKREGIQVLIDGIPLEDQKIYKIVTDDYLQRGTGYPSLAVDDNQATYDHRFIRELVEESLMDPELFAMINVRRVI